MKTLEYFIDDLIKITQECEHPGWDGYEGRPIHPGSCWNTVAFLRALPAGLYPESIYPECDGEIGMEWASIDDDLEEWVSVSISPSFPCVLTVAAEFEGGEQAATAKPMSHGIPDEILGMIRRIVESALLKYIGSRKRLPKASWD